ncbi:MAG: hypothetical protein A2X13_02105 [Bacteroidetes bacterium GWC2_33_15]|nr:MAG: hypothetical protein A2X10_07520 [Bacteroidetes bacterium GWA2_33_15]OFX52271.1 MAG: hypothetical protein A2X13_02105 [Bacteroidetes bacterium GWC2_33_15]OFX64425.1 MAG: hypothetical protein A2X15_12925 [Bacteroidetes bacterium GWB2_32_14]OFX67830.1 MAG: hypothetical protein A2X14_06750 [Bacteroidetes bacterium GWD2_33_33]HAN19446.1 hypothetical protein [Bacteroidales bacterium]
MRIEIFDSEYLNIVELNTTGDDENYVKGDSESKFIESEVFNIFTNCFENANKLYEYFGATKYNSRKIVPLRNELKKKLEEFETIDTIQAFHAHIEQIFLGGDFIDELSLEDPDWETKWKYYLDKLIIVCKGLIELADKCIEEQRILWVIGY